MPDRASRMTFEQAQAFVRKSPGEALAIMVDVLVESIEAPLLPPDHPGRYAQLQDKQAAHALLDRVNEQMKPLTALCRLEVVAAIHAPLPRLVMPLGASCETGPCSSL